MKKLMVLSLAFAALNLQAAIHPGFVNKKQCVYYKDGASQRSDCTNSNTTCASDGRCTVTLSSVVYDGDVEDMIVLLSEKDYALDYEPYQFSEDDILDLRKSNLKRNQIILEE